MAAAISSGACLPPKAAIAAAATCAPAPLRAPPPPGPSRRRRSSWFETARSSAGERVGPAAASPGQRQLGAAASISLRLPRALDQPLVVGGELLDTGLGLGMISSARIAVGEPGMFRLTRRQVRPSLASRLGRSNGSSSTSALALTSSPSATSTADTRPRCEPSRISWASMKPETFSGSTRHLLIISSARSPRRPTRMGRLLEHGPTRRVARSTGKRTTRRLGWIVVSDQPSAIRLQLGAFTGRGRPRIADCSCLGTILWLGGRIDNSSGGGPKEVVATRILACIMRAMREFDELNRPA